MKHVSSLLLFLVVCFLILWRLTDRQPPPPQPEIAEDAAPRRGFVVAADSGHRVESGLFDRKLRNSDGDLIRLKPTCWYRNKKLYTLSALGTDFRQHVVNAFLIGYSPSETEDLWVPMQTISTRLKYKLDKSLFRGMPDVWQTSKQAYYGLLGDCEDHAILLADWLIEMGYDARVVAGNFKKEGHAWVVLFEDGKTYIIEATNKRSKRHYPLARSMVHYHPRFMFNREFFWYNAGSMMTTNYTGPHWEEASYFEEDTDPGS